MAKVNLPPCKQKQNSYVFEYPQAEKYAELQNQVFWLADEIEVEKDIHDMKTNLTESEYHGVVTTLRLFTLYELFAGSEYWGGRFKRMFPRPEFQMMASCFGYFELNVHAPFYAKLNEALGLSTEEFYTDYVKDPILKSRMEFIESAVNDPDDLYSLAVFSMIEGAILFSSFAFLKHFQSEGKNKIMNVCAGINFSLRDELYHSEGGAWAFRTLLKESKLTETQQEELFSRIYEAANIIQQHELRIIDMIFEKGAIKGITSKQMTNFVESRLDTCLQELGLNKQYKPTYNPIHSWFYKNIKTGNLHDFFAKVGNEYNRKWVEQRFIW